MKPRALKSIRKERPLTEQDRAWHLPVNQPAGQPHASALAIRMNSTYLEVVDGYYSNRGVMSVVGAFAAGVGAVSIIVFLYQTARAYFAPAWDHNQDVPMFASLAYAILICSLLVWGMVALNRWIGEWFGYTHYPIRLNRRNRMVYVFRGDGTVLETPWDSTYFTLYVVKNVAGMRTLGICGLVMKDEKTVQEQFFFGYSSPKKGDCLRHWEFMRRYMEDDPQAVLNAEGFRYCLPIADRKETAYQGWVVLVSNDAWNPVIKWLMFPLHVLFFIGRLVWRAVSKVPLWPADVAAASRIEAGDPFVRDSRTNPTGFQ
ncbi:DUF6708 domain-containing protein [Paraburkholderia sp. JHI2823]|uniref:DUF6708 domain-containing protein n=1 Tax=Paraburkholderia sp. JHI2823 TaxID=3112960 RepID=UPI00317B631F